MVPFPSLAQRKSKVRNSRRLIGFKLGMTSYKLQLMVDVYRVLRLAEFYLVKVSRHPASVSVASPLGHPVERTGNNDSRILKSLRLPNFIDPDRRASCSHPSNMHESHLTSKQTKQSSTLTFPVPVPPRPRPEPHLPPNLTRATLTHMHTLMHALR